MADSAEKSAGTGEAGHCGKGVRSDVHIAIEGRESGGLEITMQSRVAPYYGDAILAQARQVFDVLGIKHARVEVRDEGALPFVISARIETAARRAGLGLGRKASPVAADFSAESVILIAIPAAES